jgi:hypothetical protein
MNLDELKNETEKLLSLLNDRQPGLFTWNTLLSEQLKTVVNLASQAGIHAESLVEESETKISPQKYENVFDWINSSSLDSREDLAKGWVREFLKPSVVKHELNGNYQININYWLDKFKVTVEWRNKRYICCGASRLGDVWLKSEGSKSFYDHRVDINELSNWDYYEKS